MAVAAIPLAVSILSSQLAAHTARLEGATDENQAVEQGIPAFDADLAEINQSYNSGAITPAQTVAALQTVDAQLLAYLKKQVGKPGTAWNGPSAPNFAKVQPGGPTCNKQCTVGCCLYYNSFHWGIMACIAVVSNWTGVPGTPSAPCTAGCYGIYVNGATATIPSVSANQYGLTNRASYNLTWKQNTSVATQVLTPPTAIGPAPVTTPPPEAPSTTVTGTTIPPTTVVSTNFLSKFTSSEIVAAIVAVGGILFTISLLFGADAVRVNE